MHEGEKRLDQSYYESRNTIQMKVMLGVMGFNAITQLDIVTSFESTCLWPLDGRFREEKFFNDNFRSAGKENIDNKNENISAVSRD